MLNQFAVHESSDFYKGQYKTMEHLTIWGGVLIISWGFLVQFFDSSAEVAWNQRLLLALVFIVTPFITRHFKFKLKKMEEVVAILVLLFLYFQLYHSLFPSFNWIFAFPCGLPIVSFLNLATYRSTAVLFGCGCIVVLGLIDFHHSQLFGRIHWSFWINFLSAVFLGGYAFVVKSRLIYTVFRNEAYREILLNNLSEGVLLFSSNGDIVGYNQIAPRLLGISVEELNTFFQHKNTTFFWDEKGQDVNFEKYPHNLTQKTGKPIMNLPLTFKKQGEERYFHFSSNPIFDGKKTEPMGSVTSFADITELKNALNTIEKQKDSLYAQSKLSALGEVSAGIAHEINNPLAVVLGILMTIQNKIHSGELELSHLGVFIDKAALNAQRVAKIVKSMRSLSRQNEIDVFQKIDIKNILSDIEEISKSSLESLGISLKVKYELDDTFIMGNFGQLGQAILNLINNSRDAIQSLNEKWIEVSVSEGNSGMTKISVTDSGLGIPIEIRERIFQPFYTTKEVGKGTGLGLSLVLSVAKLHKGSFELNPACPNTQFIIQLPR